MASSPIIVRGRRPVPLPATCVLVAPMGLHTLDGSARRPRLSIRHGDDRVGAVVADPAQVRATVEHALTDTTTSIWFSGRRRLERLQGRPPVALDNAFAAVAAAHDVRLVAFHDSSESAPLASEVYEVVREPSSFTPRRPNRRA